MNATTHMAGVAAMRLGDISSSAETILSLASTGYARADAQGRIVMSRDADSLSFLASGHVRHATAARHGRRGRDSCVSYSGLPPVDASLHPQEIAERLAESLCGLVENARAFRRERPDEPPPGALLAAKDALGAAAVAAGVDADVDSVLRLPRRGDPGFLGVVRDGALFGLADATRDAILAPFGEFEIVLAVGGTDLDVSLIAWREAWKAQVSPSDAMRAMKAIGLSDSDLELVPMPGFSPAEWLPHG